MADPIYKPRRGPSRQRLTDDSAGGRLARWLAGENPERREYTLRAASAEIGLCAVRIGTLASGLGGPPNQETAKAIEIWTQGFIKASSWVGIPKAKWRRAA